jgi:hypothetical protein
LPAQYASNIEKGRNELPAVRVNMLTPVAKNRRAPASTAFSKLSWGRMADHGFIAKVYFLA